MGTQQHDFSHENETFSLVSEVFEFGAFFFFQIKTGCVWFGLFKLSKRTEVTEVILRKYTFVMLLDYPRKSQILLKSTLLKAGLETR